MLIPIRKTVQLTYGSIVLKAWGAQVADAYLLDLLIFTSTLTHMKDDWNDYRAQDVAPEVWGAFWRLVHASLDETQLPKKITWTDRLDILMGLYELNDVEEAEGKLQTLTARAQSLLNRARAASQNLNA